MLEFSRRISDVGESVRVDRIDNPPVNGLGAAVRSHLLKRARAGPGRRRASKRSSSRARARCSAPAPTSASSERSRLPALLPFPKSSTPSSARRSRSSRRSTGSPPAEVSSSPSAATRASLRRDARLGLPEVTLGIIPGAGARRGFRGSSAFAKPSGSSPRESSFPPRRPTPWVSSTTW